MSSGADVSQATHEQTSYVYDTSLIYRKKNLTIKTVKLEVEGKLVAECFRPGAACTHAQEDGQIENIMPTRPINWPAEVQ